ncbi:MAG: polyprenyl synthetase family protein [Synergistaceae bacterium]|jgi:geranylgeranyl diphosphate synthase type II|nr:polyprenyl synthetase family protein [Synergistaceae bacterium]
MSGIDALESLRGRYQPAIDASLARLCPPAGDRIPARLAEAMTYSLTAGGKRLRPILCLASAERFGMPPKNAMPLAIAVEFIHTASLIHDDLPCMDDDDLRRGKPTNHRMFGEHMAVLAGDSLIIWAFGHALSALARDEMTVGRAIDAAVRLSDVSGPFGMCGGQVLDTDPESFEAGEDFVYKIAGRKTADLIRGSVVSGAVLGGASEREIGIVGEYGSHLGLAFQIVDDILDATGTSEDLGKTPHKDEKQGKTTFVSIFGLERARGLAEKESAMAAEAASSLWGERDELALLAGQLAHRSG